MASKFAEFLQTHNIDPRRLAIASKAIERMRPEDRRIRRLRRASKKAEGGEKPATEKPRSGRRITPQLLDRLEAGKPVSGPAKSRLLRAVNRILEQKKKEPVDLRALF